MRRDHRTLRIVRLRRGRRRRRLACRSRPRLPVAPGAGEAVSRRTATILAFAWAAVAGGVAGDADDAERHRKILRDALAAFDQAVAATRDDAHVAESLYQKAAAGFESLRADGVDNAAIEYNLGNAYFRLGRLGKAIACYRRAVVFEPTDERILANLKYAREQVEPRITPTGKRALIHKLAFWHYLVPIATRYRIAAVCSVIGWLAMMLWVWQRRRWLLTSGALLVVVALSNAGSVAIQLSEQVRTPPAVIVGDAVTLRLGRGEGYDPALDHPLGPGVEVRILRRRGDWAEVELRDEQTGWLPLSALERI
ncbi:MAG: tetratricopeptide repeat protein [Planctomycetota bacterium]|nr:MAG: tetratricopeptide repeat protein [Planctomycetota bacterium]